MSFPLSLQTWHTSSREMSLRSLPVASQAGPVTLPVPLQLGLHVFIPREARPENDLGAGTLPSWIGLPVPCPSFKKLSPQGKAENKSFKSG
jgi:hypothetical protein